MTIMDMVRKWQEKKKEKSEKYKEAEQEMKINKMLHERSMSSNERELNKIIERNRQDQISEELKKIRHQENKDMWKSNTILTKGIDILKDDRPILKERNIFVDNRNKVPLQNKRKGMFFRW